MAQKMIVLAKKGYLIYLPKTYRRSPEKWPLMFFLHGAGERGDDLSKVKVHGPPKLAEAGKQFPFILVAPQCAEGKKWSVRALNKLLKTIVAKYRVDEKRIYLTGLSMGGFGTWKLAIKYPHRFAAIAPICGWGDPQKVVVLKNVPVWTFHGAKDKAVPLQKSQELVKALKAAGGKVQLTVYAEAKHDSWTETYNNPKLFKWLLKHKLD